MQNLSKSYAIIRYNDSGGLADPQSLVLTHDGKNIEIPFEMATTKLTKSSSMDSLGEVSTLIPKWKREANPTPWHVDGKKPYARIQSIYHTRNGNLGDRGARQYVQRVPKGNTIPETHDV
jgi:hypothetical protein